MTSFDLVLIYGSFFILNAFKFNKKNKIKNVNFSSSHSKASVLSHKLLMT